MKTNKPEARKTKPPARQPSPAVRFRPLIEAAAARGLDPGAMTLRLTLGDSHKLRRDPEVAVADISFAGGVMRYLGVLVREGGVDASGLEPGDA